MSMVREIPFPPHLAEIQQQMEAHARSYGLDFFPTIFELVDCDQLNAVAAYGGFPTRYPHWRWGMEYEQLSKGYHYGLQKIYELVINNDPCYAYLMTSNEITDQKMVMAHVYGHCDFFKNNLWFAHTNRKMMDQTANHGNRIRQYMDRYGVDTVENFIDACLSIEDLIDIHSPGIRRTDDKPAAVKSPLEGSEDDEDEAPATGRLKAKDYMDSYVNPRHVLLAEAEARAAKSEQVQTRFPAQPMRDVMLFILQNAPLRSWQADVLSIVRDEAYYFAPQMQTKIMNEGWASYWHSTIMTRHGIAPSDLICYCDHHSGTMATSGGRLNPYKIGLELYRDIEERWNRGQFGKEYDECDNYEIKRRWDTKAGLGREKIFEVRRVHNDLTFIDTFLTLDFCRQHRLFSFGYNAGSEYYEVESREFPKIKERLLFNLTNAGRPIIQIVDGNYKNRGELYLQHSHAGVDLQMSYARDTLTNLCRLWTRPVHIETQLDGAGVVLSFDGSQHSQKPTETAAG
ncbi:MAG: SpoVR family protein [Planctomycetes bacterium]|nr:SpoVR family protein [Planctomycetota bacterium]